jgi:hypothetical protein
VRYEPALPAAAFERLTAARFTGADAARLTAAWADASRTFPYITVWKPPCLRQASGNHLTSISPKKKRVRDCVDGGTMPGTGVLNIIEWPTQRGIPSQK